MTTLRALDGHERKPDRRTAAEYDALEVLAIDTEDLAFHTRVVEDVARLWFALANGLPGPAEQMAARLLVVAQRRYRQKYGSDVDIKRWGVR